MAKIPEPQNTIAAIIDRHHEIHQEPPRPHLGVSMLGHPCDRYLWLVFRHAVIEKFSGRMLRLFRRGQNEEDTIISDLRAIGLDVRGAQERVDFGAHVSGSMDGLIYGGVPEAPHKIHVLEMKTHNAKSFAELKTKGVREAKPLHWSQMQVYMLGSGHDRALYVAVNKNDDQIYTERVRLDKTAASRLVERGRSITLSERLPEPLAGAAPDWYQCKWCPAHAFCHGGSPTQEVNCRTCAHSTALPDSTWHCARWDSVIPVEAQRTGCPSHAFHPELVPWERRPSKTEWSAVYVIEGREVINGEDGYQSAEILANPALCARNDAAVNAVRAEFGAKVVG